MSEDQPSPYSFLSVWQLLTYKLLDSDGHLVWHHFCDHCETKCIRSRKSIRALDSISSTYAFHLNWGSFSGTVLRKIDGSARRHNTEYSLSICVNTLWIRRSHRPSCANAARAIVSKYPPARALPIQLSGDYNSVVNGMCLLGVDTVT